MVAPGIPARVAARLAATSAGMPAAEIATGTAEGNAALGATGVAAPRRCWGRVVRRHHGRRGALFAAGVVAAPVAAGAPRKQIPHGAPDQTRQCHPVQGCCGGLAVLHDYRDAVPGNAAAIWRIAGGVAQDGGTESPPIELAPPVNADTAAPLPIPGHKPRPSRRLALSATVRRVPPTELRFAAMLIRQPSCSLAKDGNTRLPEMRAKQG